MIGHRSPVRPHDVSPLGEQNKGVSASCRPLCCVRKIDIRRKRIVGGRSCLGSNALILAPQSTSSRISSRDAASLTSSVPGLKASPKTRLAAPRDAPEPGVQPLQGELALLVVNRLYSPQQAGIESRGLCQVLKRADVLWKAGATIADPGKYRCARPPIQSQPFAYCVNGRSNGVAERGHFIDEGNSSGEKRIIGILDHLRAGDVGLEERGVELCSSSPAPDSWGAGS